MSALPSQGRTALTSVTNRQTGRYTLSKLYTTPLRGWSITRNL